jgi:hypothetical protein
MKMREGLPYMLVGSAITLAALGLRNGNIKNMVNNMVNNMKNKKMNKLEDMM